MENLTFPTPDVIPGERDLRREVRDFVKVELAGYTPEERSFSWNAYDAGFARKLGQRGWIGMTWPKQYGGHERSSLERYIVTEELLAAGAPLGFCWVADRQSGPLMLRYGTEAQRQRFLPAISAGECSFCIGMSEPDAGSDLSAVRTRATRVDGGYRVNGRKIWTSNAHLSEYLILFCRTADKDPEDRHAGFSQLIVKLDTPGINIRPIHYMNGEHRWNEVKHPAFAGHAHPINFVVSKIEGGDWTSSVPSWCTFDMRIGLYPGQDLAEVRSEVEATVAVAAQADAFLSRNPPQVVYHGFQAEGYVLPQGSDAQGLLERCHESITGKALGQRAGTGTTDARFYGLYAGIPALVYGPAAENIHAFDERVDLESMRRVTQTLALFIAEWCGVEPRLAGG